PEKYTRSFKAPSAPQPPARGGRGPAENSSAVSSENGSKRIAVPRKNGEGNVRYVRPTPDMEEKKTPTTRPTGANGRPQPTQPIPEHDPNAPPPETMDKLRQTLSELQAGGVDPKAAATQLNEARK